MSIYQRIGEAIASQGKITLVAAITPNDEHVLKTSGFKKVGTMDLNGSDIDLYEVKVTQVVNTQAPYTGIRSPYPGTQPYKTDDGYPRKYEPQWPENYRLYTYGTGTPSDLQYRGSTTSLMDAAYNPLSILEDYFFPEATGRGNSVETRTFKIDVGDLSEGKELEYVEKFKKEIHKTGHNPVVYTKGDYTNDSWTSYNTNYSGNRDFRNW